MNEVSHKFELDRNYFSLAASNYVAANAIIREITYGSPLRVTVAMKLYESSLHDLLYMISEVSGSELCNDLPSSQLFEIFRNTVVSHMELFAIIEEIVSGGLSDRVATDAHSPDILLGVVRLYAKAVYTLLYFVSEVLNINFIPESFREVFRGAGLEWELKYLGRRIDADYSVRWST